MVYFNKKDKSTTSETGNFQNGKEASISRPTASLEQTLTRAYSDKLSVTEESKKQKGNLSKNTTKNTWSLVLL